MTRATSCPLTGTMNAIPTHFPRLSCKERTSPRHNTVQALSPCPAPTATGTVIFCEDTTLEEWKDGMLDEMFQIGCTIIGQAANTHCCERNYMGATTGTKEASPIAMATSFGEWTLPRPDLLQRLSSSAFGGIDATLHQQHQQHRTTGRPQRTHG